MRLAEWFHCAGCQAKEREIERLIREKKELLGALLVSRDIPELPPVEEDEPEAVEEPIDPMRESRQLLEKVAADRGVNPAEFYDA